MNYPVTLGEDTRNGDALAKLKDTLDSEVEGSGIGTDEYVELMLSIIAECTQRATTAQRNK